MYELDANEGTNTGYCPECRKPITLHCCEDCEGEHAYGTTLYGRLYLAAVAADRYGCPQHAATHEMTLRGWEKHWGLWRRA